jgi:hypothetical protein
MSSLVLFLKCVQFMKPCVQFLMDTILNSTIVLFLIKKKGDVHYGGRITYHKKRERRINLYIMGLKSSEHERQLARWY